MSGSKVEAMAKTSPFEFIQQVRREMAKVTWPSRKETGITTLMVFVFAILSALFFFLVDQVMAVAVRAALGL
jgi:preprotein translocase subunit SecE